MTDSLPLTFEPLSPSNWHQFERLFGEKGACGGCWCMSFRLKRADFEEGKGQSNKDAMKELVFDNRMTGLLAFYEGEAIAWLSMSPREEFVKLENSRIHKRIDNTAVWSIPCFFIAKPFRRNGVSMELLKAAIQFAKEKNIKVLEAYPTIPYNPKMPDTFAWIGFLSSFEKAEFQIVDQKSKNRPMVRYYL
ncbi:GNAT family N-acetyltransferase [Solitalea koreensis]|uniref:Acetyltransferase (GNAT) family protein n=1 Tax=Solitalea koreensis TaxID=543615 RepID=A0A521DIV0_9SPHI|nr:GNAT family N-acetyltransferase [Solitalea koreensis]SMO71649.1 Acetyltransferase (GNAT) family protein [Solitalea koreensis]